MGESKFSLFYCPKCGYIVKGDMTQHKCFICDHIMFEINPKYFTYEQYIELWNQKKYGEKTHEQCLAEQEMILNHFREEVIKNHQDYNPYFFEHREEIRKQRQEELRRDLARHTNTQSRRMVNTSTPTITCPYCQSTNTKKVSAVSRGLSFSIFGFGSKKVGKQWHCNQCGSDF